MFTTIKLKAKDRSCKAFFGFYFGLSFGGCATAPLNLHSVFYHGTVEWRLFNSTLHAGEVKANIILAMAISAQGINQKYTQFRKTPIGDNLAFTFRTFLLRLADRS